MLEIRKNQSLKTREELERAEPCTSKLSSSLICFRDLKPYLINSFMISIMIHYVITAIYNHACALKSCISAFKTLDTYRFDQVNLMQLAFADPYEACPLVHFDASNETQR